MKAKFGSIVVDGRGKLGGHVYSKNRSGAYVRTKVTPTNPQTASQTAVRNRLTSFSQGWRGLTEAQRDAWNNAVTDFAKTDVFGDIKNPTGLNLYVGLNSNLAQVGVGAISTPPLPSEVEALVTTSLVASVGTSQVDVTFGPSPVPADTAFVVEATTGVSAGRNFLKNEFREIAVLDAGETSVWAGGSDWIAKFGSLIEGTKIGIRLTPVNKVTGQKGASLVATAIVGA